MKGKRNIVNYKSRARTTSVRLLHQAAPSTQKFIDLTKFD
jgi:hypothetical protein